MRWMRAAAVVSSCAVWMVACSSGAGHPSAGASSRTSTPVVAIGQPNSTAPSQYRKPKVLPSLAVIRGQYLADVAEANAATAKLNEEMLTSLDSSCGCFSATTDVKPLAAFFPPLLGPYVAESYRLEALSWELQGPQAQGDMERLIEDLQARRTRVKAIISLGPNPPASSFEAEIKAFQTDAGYTAADAAAFRADIGLPPQ